MGVLSDLQPKKVFEYFEEICNIPHGSGNVEAISDYLVKFAEDRNLEVIQDEIKNVIIIKEATEGYEDEPAVIIQGHMDMVAVHKPELDIDMTKDPLKVGICGDNIYAEGTSLGGDDGIAVAYALAILDSDDLCHPRLEVVITVDEEVGMDGARGIDLSMLKGNRLLNLDSEEEGIFWTSCAGGGRIASILDYTPSKVAGEVYQITISGLSGGHSGAEIHKERGNSNILAGRLLWKMTQEISFGVISAEGGVADNAICRETILKVVVNQAEIGRFKEIVERFEAAVKKELATKDPDFFVKVEELGSGEEICVAGDNLKKVSALLYSLPNGVQAMSADMPGLVETSLNLGILKMTPDKFLGEFAVRSSVESAKYALVDKVKAITALAGGYNEESGDYPGWAYRVNSPLRDKMAALYKEMYGQEPLIQAIHAGLECGLLAGKIEDLDCVSFGPNMKDIHTTEETLSISSTRRVWEYLVALLAKKD